VSSAVVEQLRGHFLAFAGRAGRADNRSLCRQSLCQLAGGVQRHRGQVHQLSIYHELQQNASITRLEASVKKRVLNSQVVSSAIVDKYIGESARLIREMFAYAKAHQPCIIFMDEIDAIGGRRFSEGTSADREIQRTLMELLSQLDGFDAIGKVKMIMATNRCARRMERPIFLLVVARASAPQGKDSFADVQQQASASLTLGVAALGSLTADGDGRRLT